MALLNLLLIPFLLALGLRDEDGAAAGSGTPPPDAGDKGAKPATDAARNDKTDAKPADDKKDDAELGEGGKAALEAERRAHRAEKARADSAEKELASLRQASQSESEKAINAAKSEGATEERAKWVDRAIRSESKAALQGAGAGDLSVAVAAFLDEHRDLKVTDSGDVEDLAATVESFKKAHPTLFTARVPGGSADQGVTPTDSKPTTFDEAVQRHYAPGTT